VSITAKNGLGLEVSDALSCSARVRNCAPPGSLLLDQSLHDLGNVAPSVKHEDKSDAVRHVTESIDLIREALQMRLVAGSERYSSLNTLGHILRELFYGLNEDREALEEAVVVHRKVLYMRPPGHTLGAGALNSLDVGLRTWLEHRGGIERITNAITLLREALLLRPTGHHGRYRTLDILAWTLGMSARLQGRSEQFFESITLRREALTLLPAPHPQRYRVMLNLSDSLMQAFRHGCASSEVIVEVVHLQREALEGRRLRDLSFDTNISGFSESLAARYDLCRNHEELEEAISLQRQALELRPTGHWRRTQSLHRLANLLCRPECGSWSEALPLFREGLELCPSDLPDRAPLLFDMSRCFLDPSSRAFDLMEGISLLMEAHSDQFCHVNVRLKSAVSDLRRVEEAYSAIGLTLNSTRSDHMAGRILDLYIAVIGLLPRAANFGLNHDTRLQAVAGSDEIARNAAARAVHLGRVSHAVEMLEEGRGIFWSQTLNLRAAGFDGVPYKDRQELERLLHLLEFSARRAHDSDQTIVQREADEEARRQLNQQAEALIAKIRKHPGLDRFLLPASFDGLLAALPDGYVVILNASKLGRHALLLHRSTGVAASLELNPPHTGYDSTFVKAGLPRDLSRDATPLDGHEKRAMRLDGGHQSSLEDVLALLWTSIVLPVLRELGLQVRTS
jgi:tetratricopeptide (TPR) repeat protein